MSSIRSTTAKYQAKALSRLMFVLLTSLAFGASAFADSTVYRCGPKGSQWYSQIPCTENSEQLVIKEQHKLSDTGAGQEAGSGNDADPAAADAAGNAQSFIAQLEKQRTAQLAELDRNIAELQKQAEEAAANGDSDEASSKVTVLLANLQATRDSVVSEYDAMISAAQQRIAKP